MSDQVCIGPHFIIIIYYLLSATDPLARYFLLTLVEITRRLQRRIMKSDNSIIEYNDIQ